MQCPEIVFQNPTTSRKRPEDDRDLEAGDVREHAEEIQRKSLAPNREDGSLNIS
jgi:hypothetical protein